MSEKFSIEFTGKVCDDHALGRITINDFSEIFRADLSYWGTARYVLQWIEGLSRIFNGHDSSCLLTNSHQPKFTNFMEWWTIYRFDDEVVFHNGFLFREKMGKNFDSADVYYLVPEYRRDSEDGRPLSEWRSTASAIAQFLSNSSVENK